MKKLVIKTVVITLALIISVTAIIFGALGLFAPKHLAVFFDKLGGYNASITFYERQYEKTEDIYDLVLLCDKIDKDSDAERGAEFLIKLVGHSDFSDYCLDKDKENNNGLDEDEKKKVIRTKDYYNGEYVLCLAKSGKLEKALKYSKEYDSSYGYSYKKDNPMRFIVSGYAPTATLEELKLIKNELMSYSDNSDYLIDDRNVINNLIKEMEKTNK